MRPHLLRVAAFVLIAVTTVSCGDSSPTAVPQPHSGEPSQLLGTLLGAPREVYVLQRDVPLAAPITASRTVGFFGGTIAIPQAGLSVYVPVGAVLRTTTITVTAPAGSAVAYEFSPHGTRFLVPLIVTQRLDGTAHEGIPTSSLFAAYFEDLSDLSLGSVVAPVTEILNVVLAGSNTVRFPIGHFSGYLVATGYKDRGEAIDFGY